MKQILSGTQERFTFILLLIGLAIAFWLRWQFIQNVNLYPDEFVTLLAMKMIGQKGAPILPSGLFYEHGLLYSYLAGLVALVGDPAFLGRLTSLILGLLTICLLYAMGRRWFSAPVGLLAAFGLALAPAAIHWSGRVRMYALLQLLVLLTLWFTYEGVYRQSAKISWWAVPAYLAALLTQFVAVPLLPPLILAEIWLRHNQTTDPPWYRQGAIWLRWAALVGAVFIAFLVKRAGQPKGIEPLAAQNAVGGIWDVLQIYTSFAFDLGASWQAMSPFFLEPPALVYSLFAIVALVLAVVFRKSQASRVTQFLALVLMVTTLEVLLVAPADRRDEKYLFMLLPALFLLGGQGMAGLLQVISLRIPGRWIGQLQSLIVVLIGLGLWFYASNSIADLLTDVGEDYETTFAYVAEQWQPGDRLLTGTPTAAHHFLGFNDYYAVQAGGLYDYRILNTDHGPVERWLGSPWLNSLEQLNDAFAAGPVWLVLERWGLLIQYYQPFFMQNILAQTEFVREDNGIIALKSLPDPKLLQEQPAVAADVLLNGTEGDSGQLKLLGYTWEGRRLTLYWQAQIPVTFDYTVFVNVQNEAGETVAQVDHRPLGSIYPTTLWPAGEIIRETSQLDLPPGDYQLRVGMYRLETGERLWVPSDQTLQNMVELGSFTVEAEE